MRIYELIYIVKPDIPEEEIDGVAEMVQEVIESGGGTVEKLDKWGKRRMAYRVQKYQDAFYVLVQYSTESAELPKEIERRLRVADTVIKFMTVRIDEDLKKAEKLKAVRDKRTQRRPVVAAAGSPGRPSPDAPAAPGEPDGGDDD
jgi:small subunit ribosomal protein S6